MKNSYLPKSQNCSYVYFTPKSEVFVRIIHSVWKIRSVNNKVQQSRLRTQSYLVENSRRHVFAWCGSYCCNELMNTNSRWSYTFAQQHLSRLMTKPTKWHVRPAKTQITLGIRPVWSESSLSAWRKLGSLAIHCAHSEDTDQTRRISRLIWVFAGRTVILLVLSWGGPIHVIRVNELAV